MAHSFQTSRHTTLHKRMFLVADKFYYTQHGLRLVELDWDGEMEGHSDEELKQVDEVASTHSISVDTHAGITGDWAAVFIFLKSCSKGRSCGMVTETSFGQRLLGSLAVRD